MVSEDAEPRGRKWDRPREKFSAGPEQYRISMRVSAFVCEQFCNFYIEETRYCHNEIKPCNFAIKTTKNARIPVFSLVTCG